MTARSWLLAAVVVLIAVATLLPTYGTPGPTRYCLLCGERGLADFISNVILFGPFGFAMALRGATLRHAVAAGALFTGAIEFTQIDLIPGRDATIGDIVANTAGSAIGWVIGRRRPWRGAQAFGLRGSAWMTAVTCGVLLIGLFLLRPMLPSPPYFLLWTPKYENQEQYLGRVLATALGPLEWRTDSLPMEPGTTVRPLLETGPFETRFLAGPPPHYVAPIVTVHASNREIIRLAAGGRDFVYRHWGVADLLRLDRPDLRISGVFEGVETGDTVDLAVAFSARGYCVSVNEGSRCGSGFAVGDTWTLLISPDWNVSTFQVAAVAWLWFVFLPCGYVADKVRSVAAMAGGAVLCLIAASVALGFAMTPWSQLAGVVIGLFTGYGASAAYRSVHTRPERPG